MSLQITDDNWLERFNQQVSGSADKYLLGTFTNPIVIVKVIPANIPEAWQHGGSVKQAIPFNNSLAYGTDKELNLRELNLLEFNSLSGDNYQLYYFPLDRLKTVTVTVWEYQGITKDVAVEKMVQTIETTTILNVDLSAIETRLNLLLDKFDLVLPPEPITATVDNLTQLLLLNII